MDFMLKLFDLEIAQKSAVNEHSASIIGDTVARDQDVQIAFLIVTFLVVVAQVQVPDRAINALIEIVVEAALAVMLLIAFALRAV
jgi:hypothetical protein